MYIPDNEIVELREALKILQKNTALFKLLPNKSYYAYHLIVNFTTFLLNKYPSVGDLVDKEYDELKERIKDLEYRVAPDESND